MKKNDLMTYLLLSFSILVFAPGRLAYGLILLLEFNFILVLGILFSKLVTLIKLDEMKNFCYAAGIFFFAVLFKLLLRLYSPLILFNLGILCYLPAVSVFVIGNVFEQENLLIHLKKTMLKSLYFTLYGILFFLIRDLLGFGSISLPGLNGVYELFSIPAMKYSFIGVFFASIPGSIILVSLSYLLVSHLIHFSEIYELRGVKENAE